MYESQSAALTAALFTEGLSWGLVRAIGLDPSQSDPDIFIGSWQIAISDDEVAIANSLASKMRGEVYDFKDPEIRAEVLQEITNGESIKVLREVSKGCLAAEQLSSDGQSISFDTKGDEDSDGDGLFSVFCTLRIMGAPDFVFESILSTRALDGRTEESWGEFRASWTYHPDTGMRLTVLAK
jgi:hypothetical protein